MACRLNWSPSRLTDRNIAHLFRQQIRDIENTERLEDYWEKHRLHDGETLREPVADSPLGYKASFSNNRPDGLRLSRTVTDAAALTSAPHMLSSHHPALSLIQFTKSFGPLLFPLYRAALLRKRILLVGEAPVHQTCDFGEHPEDVSQLCGLIVHSIRSLYPVFYSEVIVIATTN
jgi:hypothetical protein